ncbi:hypothetical protein RhiirC2_865509 [Rhizophagus irregularis]|uniref:BTB domain-containing protein n=1 Tax=Rhizophagus irregularis TaxID=588596 RepID=A0A2N1NCJ8_9GLOM|nr:hypothetical protein RhiirC2_865509 [Rhizophagus irregularis]
MVTNKAERLARTLDLAEVTQFFNLSPQVQEQDQRAQNQEYQWEVLSTNKVEYEISIPDVSPQCFKTLLNYMYSENICLEDYEKSEIFDLYFVAIKFNLKEIVNYLKEIVEFTF